VDLAKDLEERTDGRGWAHGATPSPMGYNATLSRSLDF
jgi:hypothetical protein